MAGRKKTDFEKNVLPVAERIFNYAAKAPGVTDVKISAGVSSDQEIRVDKGQVVHVSKGDLREITISLYAGDRNMAFVRNELDEKSLRAAIDEVVSVLHEVPENADTRLLEPALVYKGPAVELDLYDPARLPQKQLIEYAKKLEAGARSIPGVKGTETVVASSSVERLTLATNGLRARLRSGSYYAAIEAIAADASGNMKTDGESVSARYFSDMPPPYRTGEAVGAGAAGKLDAAVPQNAVDVPVILSQDAARTVFGALFRAIDGGTAYRGETFLADKTGQQVAGAGVTLIDDPRILRGIRSGYIDNNGMQALKEIFVDKGVLKKYAVDLRGARELAVAPMGRNTDPNTGGAAKTNVIILPGTATPQELMRDIKKGIYVESFNGGTIDINDGNFSCPASGRVIEYGKVTSQALDNFSVAGNLARMFMNAVLANDTPSLPNPKTAFAVPTTRINGVTIGGK